MTKLSADSVRWAVAHLDQFPDTDIFPPVFEYKAIKHCQDEVAAWITAQDLGQWQTRPFRRCLVPKQKLGFRRATQLDPLDMLFFMALAYEMGSSLESSRIGVKKRVAFSNRVRIDSTTHQFFDSEIGYYEFQQYSGELAQKYPVVALTDIADFYNRIYLHRLENTLSKAARTLPSHAKAMVALVKGWNQNVSHGLPIGSTPARLLAEVVIDDVDRILDAEGAVFTRYVDDYRIFCSSYQDAYRWLARLAQILYESHGMALQTQKTRILPAKEFTAQVLESEERKELSRLVQGFENIVSILGLENPYQQIDYEALSPAVQQQINGLNLEGMLDEQLRRLDESDPDFRMMRFLLNRLAQLGRTDCLNKILIHADSLYPVFLELIRYVSVLKDQLSTRQKESIGRYLLGKLHGSLLSHLEYSRMLILSLFADGPDWGNIDILLKLYPTTVDSSCRRSVILAAGKAGADYWIRALKPQAEALSQWERRAFMYAASCLPEDERSHWYRAVKARLDPLERYVAIYADKTPIAA